MISKRIITNEDLQKWIDSPTYNAILDFIVQLQDLVEGKPNHTTVLESPNGIKLIKIMDLILRIIDEHPVVQDKDSSRFGKVEFRDFYDQLARLIPQQIQDEYDTSEVITEELATYLGEAFGDRTRIDYGSGHELNFICFLYGLYKQQKLTKEDFPFVILKVFNKYMHVMRTLQKRYWLEPAGSHGVWGLDDYHFLPFLFGASQLATHPHMKPKLIHNLELVDQYYKDYMYLECIHFINSIKTIPKGTTKLSLRWHSPMLDDILAAKSWMKIKEGMIKMYKAEVMGKLPIMQHLMFGSLIPCPEGISEHSDVHEDECGHVHGAVNTWGDCCGIKIPSGIAASEAIKQKSIPFD